MSIVRRHIKFPSTISRRVYTTKFTFNILFKINRKWVNNKNGWERVHFISIGVTVCKFYPFVYYCEAKRDRTAKKPPPQNIQHKRWTIDFLGLSLHYIFIYFRKEKKRNENLNFHCNVVNNKKKSPNLLTPWKSEIVG